MKVFVTICALVVAAAADISIQEPLGDLQPPFDGYPSKDFNAPWTGDLNDPQKPINVIQNNEVAVPQNDHHQHHHHQEQHVDNHQNQHHGPSTSSVSVNVIHPNWATSFANIQRFDQWPSYMTPVSYIAPAPVTPILASYSAPMAPIVAPYPPAFKPSPEWNHWNEPAAPIIAAPVPAPVPVPVHSHAGWAKAPIPVAKYVAVTPGAVHIAPLPGHTVSQKIINLAPAPAW
ncbi:protein eyes shut-like [Uranotaenia lowii]|uniref:protein eyes shut-like n=1 Tax=Uranotaenia lowii TaxID=190385 RepID=UPI00247AC16E|nr:protein eyes shut-like [Uranotaenia lowii]